LAISLALPSISSSIGFFTDCAKAALQRQYQAGYTGRTDANRVGIGYRQRHIHSLSSEDSLSVRTHHGFLLMINHFSLRGDEGQLHTLTVGNLVDNPEQHYLSA
jgi:hypothetical protein